MADQLITGTTLIEDKRTLDFGKTWSCSGCNFKADQTDVADVQHSNGSLQSDATSTFVAPVFLPNGAVVTEVIIYGSISDETWTLSRITLSTAGIETMASGSFNSADTTISNDTVNNDTYCYYISTSSLDVGDVIYGARIKYS